MHTHPTQRRETHARTSHHLSHALEHAKHTCTYAHTHTRTQTHAHTHARTQTHTHMHRQTRTYTRTPTDAHSLSHTHLFSLSLHLSFSLSFSLSHTHMHTHMHTHTHTLIYVFLYVVCSQHSMDTHTHVVWSNKSRIHVFVDQYLTLPSHSPCLSHTHHRWWRRSGQHNEWLSQKFAHNKWYGIRESQRIRRLGLRAEREAELHAAKGPAHCHNRPGRGGQERGRKRGKANEGRKKKEQYLLLNTLTGQFRIQQSNTEHNYIIGRSYVCINKLHWWLCQAIPLVVNDASC